MKRLRVLGEERGLGGWRASSSPKLIVDAFSWEFITLSPPLHEHRGPGGIFVDRPHRGRGRSRTTRRARRFPAEIRGKPSPISIRDASGMKETNEEF